MDELLESLRQQQKLVLEQLFRVDESEYNKQYHPDLSPLGWHVGHCVYTESYWIREAWLKLESCPETLKALYIPELCHKSVRGEHLPGFNYLLTWARETQADNLQLIDQFKDSNNDHELMQENFLIHFLIQHYAQHSETMQMILHARELEKSDQYSVINKLSATTLMRGSILIPQGHYEIGAISNAVFYDNEIPMHSVQLNEYCIGRNTITNAEYLGFIEQGAYENKSFWSDAGWHWRSQNNITLPLHWRLDEQGHCYGVNQAGAHDLNPHNPVTGINYYEATAFAVWANARLPHEYEWETAVKLDKLENTCVVWEWCANTFHPYTGFKAFPYAGYSLPYFDDQHFTLKGGSHHTQAIIKRPSFRNYYQADKRHIFAGLRLVY